MRVTLPAVKLQLLFFLLLSAGLRATVPAPGMRHYTVNEGLLSDEVHCIFQDSRGKLWFGSAIGVSCFDGTRFTHYTMRDGLAGYNIFGISEDRRGRIWFRSYRGMLSWFDGEKIVQPALNAQLGEKLKGQLVTTQTFDGHDTLWIGTRFGGCWLKIPPGCDTIIEQPIPAETGLLFCEISPGKLGVTGHYPGDRIITQGPRGIVQPLKRNPDGACHSWPFSCAVLNDGTRIMQFSTTAYIFSGGRVQVRDDSAFVSFIYPDKGNDYWLCGRPPGGARLMRRGKEKDVLVKQYLGDYTVTSCLRDHEGGLWFGTQGGGLFYLPFPELEDVYTLALVKGDAVTSITSWPGGGALAGTLLGNFFIANEGKCVPWTRPSPQPTCVRCLSRLGQRVLIGQTPGSAIYDHSTGSLIPLFDPASGESLSLQYATPYDHESWYAVSLKSLYRINSRSGATEELCKLPERISSIARTHGDIVWLGGTTRLWMMAPGQKPVDWGTRFPATNDRSGFLASDTLSGTLWMASLSRGLFAITSSGVLDMHRLQPGLPPVCNNMQLIGRSLWLCANDGIWELNLPQGRAPVLRRYDQSNGMPGGEIDMICSSQGRIWLAGENVLFGFSPEDYPKNAVPPQISIRDIFCNGRTLLQEKESTFAAEENTFHFQLAGQSYKPHGKRRFLVRMLGLGESWHETDQSDLTYYDLQPGDYEFMAFALNNDGVKSAKPVRYAFTILPPFWKRSWFIIAVSVLLLAAAAWLIYAYLRRFRKEESYRRRLAELEITAIRAQMNPHFIFNAINSIYNYVLTDDPKKSATYVARFAKLIRNVLEFAPLKQITLEEELETLRLYMDIEQLRFRESFEYAIEVDPALEPEMIYMVPMLIQPYVENAIWHGLLHKDGKRRLAISVRRENDQFVCTIDDNGIGRAEAAKISTKSLPKNSLGSLLNRRRLELLGELYGLAFEVRYVDKDPQEHGETGTRVILRIPEILNSKT